MTDANTQASGADDPAASRGLRRRIGGSMDRTVGQVGRRLGSAVKMSGLVGNAKGRRRSAPGTPPGIEHLPEAANPPPRGSVGFTIIDYGRKAHLRKSFDTIEDLLAFPRGEGMVVRWINIDGLHPYVVRKVAEAFGYHSLSAEDVLGTHQRPRVEAFDDELYIVARMTRLIEDRLVSEQVSMFLQPGLVVTFQETPGDVWDPVRARIADATMRVRRHDASFLIYALIDAIVDHGFPILERYGELIETMESQVLDAQPRELLQRIHAIKREMTQLRRTIWPTREVVVTLMQENTPYITAETRTYLRDVYEHTVQLVEIVELYREMASGLTDLFLSAISNRTNQIIKVLTIMASLFIPTTFLAGVYGMNFEHQPEFAWRYGYHMFWAIALTVIFGLLAYFWRKGWIGRG